jgi:tyrosyl-tRNA synthetase
MHEGAAPSDAPTHLVDGPIALVDLLNAAGLVTSKSEGRRLISQGGVRLDGQTINQVDFMVQPHPANERTLQAGKRRFLRLVSG